MSSVELFQKGGPVMYLLLVCSLSVAAILIDRYLFYKKAGAGTAEIIKALYQCVAAKKAPVIADSVGGPENIIRYVQKTASEAAEAGNDVKVAVDMAYDEAAMLLRSRLNYLSMIVTMAPLLGLLGTIAGMIQSFSIFNLQAGQPMAITGGIGEALIATATGLCVAIFSLLVHTYYAQRMDRMLTDLEKATTLIVSGYGNINGGAGREA